MATNPFDQFDAPASATNPFDQFDAPVAPTRTWGQVLADRAMGVGAAGLDMIGSAVNTANTKTPWDNIPGGATAFSALETGAGLMGAASGVLPQGINDRVGAMRQYLAESRAADPESQQPRSEFAQSFANTSGQYADAARAIQSEKEKATQQRMAEVSKEGFLPTVAELATNPSALATATDSLIPSLAAGGGAGRLAGGLMGAKAAGQTAAQIGTMSAIEGAGSGDGAYEAVMQAAPDVLAADPVYQRLLDLYEGDDTKARETLGQMARSASTVSGTASAALLQGIGQRLGLNVAEDTLLGRITAGQTGSRTVNAGLGGAKEFVGEATQGAANQLSQNVGTILGGAESDVMAGVGGAAALEGMAGLGSGLIAGALQTPRPTPRTPAEAGSQAAEDALQQARARKPPATPAPVAAPSDAPLGDIPAESTTDLDAAIDAMLAPTTETAPDGRLGTSAPIAAPPVVGSSGLVDATAAAPDPVTSAVGDVAPETGRRPFLTPDDVAREQFTARAAAAGLSSEQIAQMTPDTLADDVTGFFDGRLKGVKSGTILRAQEHVEATGEPAFYVDGDIVNLGGLNKAAGENMEAANAHYRAMTDILRAELESTGGDIVPLRTGGDEVGAVVVNAPEPAIRAAMTAANAKVRAYAQANGFGDIPHTKADRTDRGVGLHLGLAPIQPGASLSDIIEASSAEIAASKGGTPDVNGSQTERLGPVAPVGPAGSVGGSVATEAQGIVGQDAARLGQAPSAQGDAQGVRAAPQVIPADQFGPGFDPLPNAEADFAPVGSWVDGPGPDSNSPTGRILYQVRDVPIADLDMPELVDGDIAPEKRSFMPEYERRAASGEQPPNIVVTERNDGTLKVSDGTRRTIAAMRAGKDTIRALVSPSFSESRPAPPPSARPAPKGRSTLRAIAKTIGLDLADFKRHGVDPANFRGSKGSMPGLFRKQGGMTLSRFREWAQENEYLPRDPENAPPTVSDDDALDLFYRLFANEEAVALGDADANVQAKAEQERKRAEDRLNADPAAAMQRQRARDIGNEPAMEALADFDAGLLTEAGLRAKLNEAENYDENMIPFSRRPANGGLLDAPTSQEAVAVPKREKDAKRNGQTGAGQTDMPPGKPAAPGEVTRGLSVPVLERLARSLFAGWANAPTVRVEAKSPDGEIEGQFDPATNTVTLYADALSSLARARWVAYHEVTGHYGMRGVLEGMGKGLGSFDRQLGRVRSNPTIDALARAIAFDRKLDATNGRALNLATEEAMAELAAAEETGDWQHLADRYNVTVPASMRPGIRGAIDRFVQAIKRLFSIIAEGRTDAFTDADWRELVAGARRYVRKKPEPKAEPENFDVDLEFDVDVDGETVKATGNAQRMLDLAQKRIDNLTRLAECIAA